MMNGKRPAHWSALPGLRLAALLACVMLAPATLAKDLYQWTDENGVRQFSDTPPPGQIGGAAEGMTVGEWLAAQQEAERRAQREAIEQQLAAPPEPEPEPQTQLPMEVVNSPYSCSEARDILAAHERPGTRLFYMDENGAFVRSTDEEIQATIAEWQQAVGKLCRDDVELVRPGGTQATGETSADEGSEAGIAQ